MIVIDTHVLVWWVSDPVSVEIARLAGTFAETIPGDPADRVMGTAVANLRRIRELGESDDR